MPQHNIKTIDQALKNVSLSLRRCKVARDALVGFSNIGAVVVGKDVIQHSALELVASASQVQEHVQQLVAEVEAVTALLHIEFVPQPNGPTTDPEEDT